MKKMFSMLAGLLLVLNLLTPACFAENEAATGDGEDTTGTVAEDGAVHLEFEDLAESVSSDNIIRDVAWSNDVPGCTKIEDKICASGNALWGNTNTETDPSKSFTFQISKAGYYNVLYAVGDARENQTHLSKVTLSVDDVQIGDNINNTIKEDLSEKANVADYGYQYPWWYEPMHLLQGTALCYLTEGEHTLSVNVALTPADQKYKFLADYIEFIPASASVTSTDDYMTRITPDATLPLVADVPASFDFTVPTDGNYAFMVNRNTDYTDTSVTTVSVATKDGTPVGSFEATWGMHANGGKPYARIGNGVLDLQKDVDYVLSVSSTAGFTTSYFDVIRTDIDVNEKVVIPAHYCVTSSETGDHFRNNTDSEVRNLAETAITGSYSDYDVVGDPKSWQLGSTKGSYYAPISVLIQNNGGYIDFKLNIPVSGNYSFETLVSVYSDDKTATGENVYFSVDGTELGAVPYAPTSFDDRHQVLKFRNYFDKGTHTLRISRKIFSGDAVQNQYMYIPFLTAEPVNSAMMYQTSVASENIISSVQNGKLIARIHNLGTFTAKDDVKAFFAIYDDTKEMVAVASYLDKWPSANYVDLTIEGFEMKEGRTYQAKAFLWNDKLQGESFTLASFPSTTE